MKEKASYLIALVDDDESVREGTSALLRSNGFTVEAFAGAEEFFYSLLRTKTDCLLLDVGMPGMDGLELQRQLIAQASQIPVIFVTAHDKQEVRSEAMRFGAANFLAKPFSEEGLLTAIRTALKIPPVV